MYSQFMMHDQKTLSYE